MLGTRYDRVANRTFIRMMMMMMMNVYQNNCLKSHKQIITKQFITGVLSVGLKLNS